MYCTHCGTELPEATNFCISCGQRPNIVSAPIDKELHYVIPVSTPLSALAAGYLGLFSVLFIPAPFALIFGVIGLNQIKKKPDQYGVGRCWTGIILGGIFTLLLVSLPVATLIGNS